MDPWLTDETKELFFQPCLEISGHIARRLNDWIRMGQTLSEPSLTEDFVELFDTDSRSNVWGTALRELRDRNIYLRTNVRKAKAEHRVGADIGLIVNRSIYEKGSLSCARYACLIQCKKIDEQGEVSDFYHVVKSSGKKQSTLMLDITSSSFYFLYVPSALVKHYCNFEPIAFLRASPGCSVPVWNNGSFAFESVGMPFLSAKDKAEVVGVLVVPALAVEAQRRKGRGARLRDILPNCLPLWYWFSELLIPGFVGDRRDQVVGIAASPQDLSPNRESIFGVRYTLEITFGREQRGKSIM